MIYNYSQDLNKYNIYKYEFYLINSSFILFYFLTMMKNVAFWINPPYMYFIFLRYILTIYLIILLIHLTYLIILFNHNDIL